MEEVHVPHDVIFNHILPRVPTKSVCRFRCVSKEWHSFLKSDMFKNKHSHHVDHQRNNLKFLFLSKTKNSFQFATIDCEAPQRRMGLIPMRRPLPQFRDTTPGRIHILTSFHGLVCLRILETYCNIYYDLILWNPLTSEYKTLPMPKYDCHMGESKFGLYYSCCEDDYKLLYVDFLFGHVYIYSLKPDSWRKVNTFHHSRRHTYGMWSQGTYLNENIYFLQYLQEELYSSFIVFDTKTELFSEIEETLYVDDDIPDANSSNYFATIMVKSDCIHVCEKYDTEISGSERTCIKLCKLDKHEHWKKVVNYQLKHDDYITPYLRPFHLMKNGNWIMTIITNDCSNEHCIYEVDLKEKKHIKDNSGKDDKGNIYDDYELYGSNRVDNMHLSWFDINHVGYTETFVSPNQHMK